MPHNTAVDTHDQDVLSSYALARAYEYDRYLKEHKNTIILSEEDRRLYFTAAMSNDDRRVMKQWLVHIGKASYAV